MRYTGPNAPAIVATSFTITVVNGKTVVTLAFSGSLTDASRLLIDGRYELRVRSNKVHGQTIDMLALDGDLDGLPGGDNLTPFHRLFGDSNGDATMAANDFIQFRLALGGSVFDFDFDFDGAVAASDFIQFRLRFGGGDLIGGWWK